MQALEPIERRDLHYEVVSRLVDLLIASRPGTRLPSERQIGESLKVGRSTVREALRALASIGAVEIRRGDGIFVGNIDEAVLRRLVQLGLVLRKTTWADVVEARYLLESQVVMIASIRWDEDDVAKLDEISDELRTYVGAPAQSSPRASELDLEFHLALAAATHNEMLSFLVQSVRGLFETWIEKGFSSGRLDIADIVREHDLIMGAVKHRDPVAASQLMGEHIDKSTERLLGRAEREQLIANSYAIISS